MIACCAVLVAARPGAAPPARGTSIEDFESGTVILAGYPGQDVQPDAWELTGEETWGGSAWALRLHGNTWKTESIDSAAVDSGTVWRVATLVERTGDMQAFGVGDGTNELLYTFAGADLPQGNEWWTVYQGAFPVGEWTAYLLPIGRDWMATYGYLPAIDRLFYINDDDGGSGGEIVFDEIADVTDDLPVAPSVTILRDVKSCKQLDEKRFRVGVQFHCAVVDPDSDTLFYCWDFGDGGGSGETDPYHEFLIEADYAYTVGLTVYDPDRLAGHDTCRVAVEPGEGDLPFTINFVGDIFTGRAYEYAGGIIETQGIEALFEPTLGIFGNAADLNVCNLECSYTDRGTPHPTKSVVFRSRPENIHGIRYAGVDLVTLANNHIVDYGGEGMAQTIDSLDAMGIAYSGAGANETYALRPVFRSMRGIRVAFLGQCNRCGRKWNYQPFLDAGACKPGFAYLVPHNLEQAIPYARDLADVVVIQLHSGDEYQTAPPERGGPPRIEASEIAADDPDFRFRVEPTLGERALRRMAIDLGADVVINHHPHVLQGFESYDGRLIAHSLGNFIFDLYYPETMPTIVLTLEIDDTGIIGYTFVPAWIDDTIPHPATGRLGREILDRMADYSRPMGALVAVDPEACRARIHLSRSAIDSTVSEATVSDTLVEEDGWFLSPPLEIEGRGNLSEVVAIETPSPTGWDVRWGREILWHGGFEEEGATLWEVNTSDEWITDSLFHSGKRCLALRRTSSSGGQTGTDLERHLPCDPEKEHSSSGLVRAENAGDPRVLARFYADRYSSSYMSSTQLADPFDGDCDWTRQWRNLETPAGADYFEVRCGQDPPSSGVGLAWFDDIRFIEWEPWTPAEGGAAVPSPNNHRFLQVRTSSSGIDSARVRYAETAYDAVSTETAAGTPPPPAAPFLRNAPNPFNPRTIIECVPPGRGTARASLAVYDIRGRRTALLFDGALTGGETSRFVWDGRDDRGRPAPSGVYLARMETAGGIFTRKMVLLR
ncbi:MAG: CapA family protein [Candidatus Eisenbacteria bacterium]|nr:CapA family protein [Candidatus Eisenbacteria bacterium]